MSHTIGTVPVLTPQFQIGPDTGEAATSGARWEKGLAHDPAPNGTKFVILHFTGVDLPAGNRVEVDLGYDTDVFTTGGQFWTRPVNVDAVGASIPIRYVADGSTSGIAFVDRYARGESLQSHATGHDSITNCDPFLVDGTWDEPDFPHIPGSTDPKYDPFWICGPSADWQNAACAVPGQVWADVARSVGMIVTVHPPDMDHPFESVGSCSVTLIDSDLVVLAGHCVSNHSFEVPTSSVTFDYEVDCMGNRETPYNPRFYKVERLVKYRWSDGRDYAILKLEGAPPLPPVPVAGSDPLVGDPVFGVHHPNGAVKKIGPSAGATTPVVSTSDMIEVNLDVAGGSSGSGLFNAAGEIVGVLSWGWGGCTTLHYSSTEVMLSDPITTPDPPTARRVMIVLDRSGSMSGTAGDGKLKIVEARGAAELFVSLLRSGMGNRAGLVSFAGTAGPAEAGLGPVDGAKKTTIINALPGITPGGSTSIGGGLDAARSEYPLPGDPPRTILLLTDGMENTPPLIAGIAGLGGIDITAIGFGTEANLDGPRLAELAHGHNGFYKRAGSGLELKKFFALAFGDIFEAGALADPQEHLAADIRVGRWIPFHVCEEEAITVVAAWDVDHAAVELEVRTPSGRMLDLDDAAIDHQSGASWEFARIPLPQDGEREGVWQARIRRVRPQGTEFPPPDPALEYFIEVIARGGPRLRPIDHRRRLYTGDDLNPLVALQYPDETVVRNAKVSVSVTRPDASVGTLLASHGLGGPAVVDGDVIPAKQATLAAIEAALGQPVVGRAASQHVLDAGSESTGLFIPAGVFGRHLGETLVVEGTYTFHAKAEFGVDCAATREVQWSQQVAVGIDPGRTDVDVRPSGSGPGGDRFTVTITPKDRYGNHLGPAEGDGIGVDPLPGCSLVGDLVDNGDGTYSQAVECGAEGTPGVSVSQPGRDPVDLLPETPPRRRRFVYTAKLLCGSEAGDCGCDCGSVGPGRYTTAVTIVNTSRHDVPVRHFVVPTEKLGATVGRWPDAAGAVGRDGMVLPPGSATTLDCCSVQELLLEGLSDSSLPMTLGVVVIETPVEVSVVAAYTVAKGKGSVRSIDIETIQPHIEEVRPAEPEAPHPRRPVVAPPAPPAERRQADEPVASDADIDRQARRRDESGA